MIVYLKYDMLLKEVFAAFELVHVPREQNARADLLAKLASSGRGGRQRTVIQETLKAPRTTTGYGRGPTSRCLRGRKERSLVVDPGNIKVPKISTYDLSIGESSHVCLFDEGET